MPVHHVLPSALRCLGAVSAIALLTAFTANAATPENTQRAPFTFAGAALDKQRAARLAQAGGFELIDFHACNNRSASCAQLAVRQPGGRARVYQLSDQRCAKAGASCLGGFTVTAQLNGRIDQPKSAASATKTSAAPGEDGAPPDPQDEAQANATNEIIEALGDGKYEGNEDQFWVDLDSIQTWTKPSWLEPDPPPERSDKVRTTGSFGNVNPGVLISGRYENDQGDHECRLWVGYTSTTRTVGNVGNWVGNAVFDGCDSEVAMFSENGAAQLVKPEGRWSKGVDDLEYAVEAPITIPTSVWVIHANDGYAAEQGQLEREFEHANKILASSKCGIELEPTYHDKTAALADPEQNLGCASIESTFKKVGFHAGKMNVYIVKSLISEERAGVACIAESDNVIVVDQGRSDSTLVHEYGHWLDLWHTGTESMPMPLVNIHNIMSKTEGSQNNMLTAGQCYRANFSKDSYININKQNVRTGKTKQCKHLQDADGQCPGLKNEF